MRKFILCFCILWGISAPSFAQYAKSQDVFSAEDLIAPAALLATGTLIHCFAHDTWDASINKQVLEWRGANGLKKFDNYTQYLPLAAGLGLGLVGVESKHKFTDRLIVFGLSYVSTAVITRGMKLVINSPRPDLSDNKSFPSGHSSTVFLGAELVRMEYGWGWGAGAYVVAAGTAYMRMYNQKHWFSDLLMGAGVGILGAHIGQWLLDPVKSIFRKDVAVAGIIDPVSGVPCMALCYNF